MILTGVTEGKDFSQNKQLFVSHKKEWGSIQGLYGWKWNERTEGTLKKEG